jgi:cyclic pyranopterin phosphate synthase
MSNQKLSHFDEHGNARMVDVGEKNKTVRRALAEGYITMHPQTLRLIQTTGHEKGDVLLVARVASIMAAKRTADIIPLCHPLPLTRVEIDFEFDNENSRVRCEAVVETRDRTGVEMEALMAVQIALLTIYDMCKKTDRGMTLGPVQLLEKSGGASGLWRRGHVETS